MKNRSRVLSFFLFAVAFHSEAKPLNVTIDPGHGGKDHGAYNQTLRESDLTLAVALRLEQRLTEDPRFRPLMVRRTDEFLSLNERVHRTQEFKSDLFLSIHANWSKEKRARGLEVYFQNQLPPDEESMFLAARENHEDDKRDPAAFKLPIAAGLSPEVGLIVQDLARNQRIFASSRLARSLRESWRGKAAKTSVQQAPFFVISNLNIPSALVEIGFLSNPHEAADMATPHYQDLIAQSLHDGLIQYLDFTK